MSISDEHACLKVKEDTLSRVPSIWGEGGLYPGGTALGLAGPVTVYP